MANIPYTFKDKSGTIAAGGSNQRHVAANPGRQALTIYNPHTETNVLYVNFGAPAVIGGAGSIGISPGGSLHYTRSTFVPIDEVHVIGATTGQKFTIKEA